jgi:uncharacterized protein YutE (UPF0331/DUF86 family)
MDKNIVFSKVESLRACIERIRQKTPASVEVFAADYDLQDIVCLNLERAVQICVDIAAHIIAELDVAAPGTMADSFEKLHAAGFIDRAVCLRMQKAVGFRNIAVHTYQAIDWQIVYTISTEHLTDFSEYARQVTKKLEQE